MAAQDTDYYELLGLEHAASDKEIRSAFRRRALQCHPDKVGDDAAAADLFLLLNKAYDCLADPALKAAYDTTIAAKLARKRKFAEMDAKRRKLREDLEKREQAAKDARTTDKLEEKQMQLEIERLREEGRRILEQRNAKLAQQQQKPAPQAPAEVPIVVSHAPPPPANELERTLKVKWKRKIRDFAQAELDQIFSQYGRIEVVAMSDRKPSALVQFGNVLDAAKLFRLDPSLPSEKNILDIFTISWAAGVEPEEVTRTREQQLCPSEFPAQAQTPTPTFSSARRPVAAGAALQHSIDPVYEQSVLARMRERQREREQQAATA